MPLFHELGQNVFQKLCPSAMEIGINERVLLRGLALLSLGQNDHFVRKSNIHSEHQTQKFGWR
jgi:hypothetical protein